MKTSLLLIMLAAAVLPCAQAELATSRLDIYAGHEEIRTKSSSYGSVEDQKSLNENGQFVLAQTVTPGLSFAPLPQFPNGGTFIVTDLFTSRAEASQSIPQSSGSASAISSLQRSALWSFNALNPSFNGAQGSIRFKFKYSWAQRVQGTDTASLNLGFVISDDLGDAVAGDAFSQTLPGTGGLTSSSGTAFWTSVPIPFQFGVPLSMEWTLSDVAGVTNGPDWYCIAKGSAELWDAEVFDAAGNPLVRFSDYDWIEFTGTQNTPYPVATSMMLPPPTAFVAIGRNTNRDVLVNFSGVLEESANLEEWSVVDPTIIAPYQISPPLPGKRFFRARQSP